MKLYVSVAVVSFFVALSGAMMPGPMMLATVTASRKHGFRAGPLIATSHAALELVMVMVLFTGARQLLTRERLIGGLGIVGALVLAWMGIAAIAYARSATLDGAMERPPPKLISSPLLAGVVTTAGNPQWWIWWPTVGFSYLAIASQSGAAAVVPFYLGHISGDYLVYTGISAAITGGRKFFKDIHFRFIIAGCGVFLIGIAGLFAAMGIRRFL